MTKEKELDTVSTSDSKKDKLQSILVATFGLSIASAPHAFAMISFPYHKTHPVKDIASRTISSMPSYVPMRLTQGMINFGITAIAKKTLSKECEESFPRTVAHFSAFAFLSSFFVNNSFLTYQTAFNMHGSHSAAAKYLIHNPMVLRHGLGMLSGSQMMNNAAVRVFGSMSETDSSLTKGFQMTLVALPFTCIEFLACAKKSGIPLTPTTLVRIAPLSLTGLVARELILNTTLSFAIFGKDKEKSEDSIDNPIPLELPKKSVSVSDVKDLKGRETKSVKKEFWTDSIEEARRREKLAEDVVLMID